MSGTTTLAYIVTTPFLSYTRGQLVPVSSLTPAQYAADHSNLAGPITITGTTTPPASSGGTTTGTSGGTSTGGTTTGTGSGGIALTTAQAAALAAYPALSAAEIADASAIGTHAVHLATLDIQVNTLNLQRSSETANITSLQQQSSANVSTEAAQGLRLNADDTEIAALTAEIAALQAASTTGTSTSGTSTTGTTTAGDATSDFSTDFQ